MAVHGYITHAAHNRRFTALLVLGYVLAFEVIGAFALTMALLYWDHEHTILSNPAGYALRYAAPIAVVAGLMFWWIRPTKGLIAVTRGLLDQLDDDELAAVLAHDASHILGGIATERAS